MDRREARTSAVSRYYLLGPGLCLKIRAHIEPINMLVVELLLIFSPQVASAPGNSLIFRRPFVELRDEIYEKSGKRRLGRLQKGSQKYIQ